MHVDIPVTPVRMDSSCCRKNTILDVRVRKISPPNQIPNITSHLHTVYCLLYVTLAYDNIRNLQVNSFGLQESSECLNLVNLKSNLISVKSDDELQAVSSAWD